MNINFILFLLSFFMTTDYIITYVEIHILQIATEMNPLMYSFMELPFAKGFVLRILLALTYVLIFKIVEKYRDKKYLSQILLIPLSFQFIPILFHLRILFLYCVAKI